MADASQGVVVRPYRDPLVLGPLFRDEEPEHDRGVRDGPRTLWLPAAGGATPRPVNPTPPCTPNAPADPAPTTAPLTGPGPSDPGPIGSAPTGPAPAGPGPIGSAPTGPGPFASAPTGPGPFASAPAGPAPAGPGPIGSAPGPGPIGSAPARPAAGGPVPAGSGTAARAGVRRTLPPVLDPKLVERPARACSGWWALLVVGLAGTGAAVLARYTDPRLHRPLPRTPAEAWPLAALAACALLALAAVAGLRRGRAGHAWALTLFGRYRGTIRRTGLIWSSPLPRHARVDVRLRHWRSEPLPVVDAEGTALRAVVLVVWRVKDTARALLSVEDHAVYLRGQVESVTARVLSRMPADSFRPPGAAEPATLRDTEAVGDELTALLTSECRAVGIEVFSARPLHVEYAPEVAAAMQRRRIAAIDARHRDSVLTSVIDAVDDTVHRMSDRGLVSLDDYERKALVKDLTVAFYTARGPAADAR
ncbi:SPFH domain-containing protein [Streptomyces sp. NPDC057011]|uniref:SPFH domain-containing protein n=1 Tax=unclassified Streptomyces TaxID=2593676 RepID=UPI003642167E